MRGVIVWLHLFALWAVMSLADTLYWCGVHLAALALSLDDTTDSRYFLSYNRTRR